MVDAGSTHHDLPIEFLAFAEGLIDNHDRATGWMNTPNFALGGSTPFSILGTEADSQNVRGALGVITYGSVA